MLRWLRHDAGSAKSPTGGCPRGTSVRRPRDHRTGASAETTCTERQPMGSRAADGSRNGPPGSVPPWLRSTNVPSSREGARQRFVAQRSHRRTTSGFKRPAHRGPGQPVVEMYPRRSTPKRAWCARRPLPLFSRGVSASPPIRRVESRKRVRPMPSHHRAVVAAVNAGVSSSSAGAGRSADPSSERGADRILADSSTDRSIVVGR